MRHGLSGRTSSLVPTLCVGTPGLRRSASRPLPFAPLTSLRMLTGSRMPMAYRVMHAGFRPTAARGALARDAGLATIEAALMVADEPLPARRLATSADLKDAAEARRLVRRLQSLYQQEGSAFQIEELAGGFQLLTRPEFHPWLTRLRQSGHELRLSQASRETLAIIAYRQPIMRAEIEKLRGVQCGELLRLLMEKGLIRITGRHPSLGRPVLYGTTRKFLQIFGLRGIEDLPLATELRLPAGQEAERHAPAEGPVPEPPATTAGQ